MKMPAQRKTKQFWNDQELLKLLRKRQAIFRRTAKLEPSPQDDATHPKEAESHQKLMIYDGERK